MAGADEPATLSGLCQPMAIAMVGRRWSSGQRRLMIEVVAEDEGSLVDDDHQILVRRYRHPYWQTGLLAQVYRMAVSNIP
jgi:hypothetical protein